jgi:hypothetical protein
VTASSSGNATTYIDIPAALGGRHTVSGRGSDGSIANATFTVQPRIALSPAKGLAGSSVRLSMRGFKSAEQVEIRIDAGSGLQAVTTTTVSSATGSRNLTVQIPVEFTAGTISIIAVGNAGTNVSAPFTVTGPAQQLPVPTPTATPTVTPTVEVTQSPTVTPTSTPALEPSPTRESSATPTETPSPADPNTEDVTPLP